MGWKSVILGVWATPGAPGTLPLGGGRRPSPFGMVSGAPGAARTLKMIDFRPLRHNVILEPPKIEPRLRKTLRPNCPWGIGRFEARPGFGLQGPKGPKYRYLRSLRGQRVSLSSCPPPLPFWPGGGPSPPLGNVSPSSPPPPPSPPPAP